ncbi:hypothetical protein Tco_1296800 [Tanacetum coccineum]
MENEYELSYKTLKRVYLGSYEHYKSVGAVPLRNFFKQRIAAMMGYSGGRGLEDDEEWLHDELNELESSYGVLFTPCDAAAKKERQRGDVAKFCTKNAEDI